MGELLEAEVEEKGGPGVSCPHPDAWMGDRAKREKLHPEAEPGADFTRDSETLQGTSSLLWDLHGHVVQGREGRAQRGLFPEPRGPSTKRGRRSGPGHEHHTPHPAQTHSRAAKLCLWSLFKSWDNSPRGARREGVLQKEMGKNCS